MSYASGVTPRLRQILQSSDLSTISAKAVRKELVRLGENEEVVKANRKDIDAKISEIYDELTGPPSVASSSSEEVALTSSRPSAPQSVPIPPSSFPEPLAERKPKIKAEAKEEKPKPSAAASSSRAGGQGIANGAGLDRYGGVVETDEQMARRLQEEFDAMENGRPSRRSAAARPKKVKKKAAGATKKRKSAATVDSDDEGGEKPAKKRRAGGGSGAFNKDLVLSDALAEFTGEARLSRPQTVKRIWDYVKANDLQDTGDKRFIICDDRLRSVFHTDRLHMFTMNKLLSQHFMDPDDIIPYKEDPAGVDVKPIPHPPPVASVSAPTVPAVVPTNGINPPRQQVSAVYDYSDDDDDDEEDDYEDEE